MMIYEVSATEGSYPNEKKKRISSVAIFYFSRGKEKFST